MTPKPFNQIPGPIRLPVLGCLYMFKMPGFYKIWQYQQFLYDMHKKYGPLVRVYRGNALTVHAFDIDDAKTVLNADGKYPVVPPLQEQTQLYRKSRSQSLGLGNTNGEEWYRLRSAVQKMMLRPQEVHHYLPLVDTVAKSFLEALEDRLDNHRMVNSNSSLRHLVAKWILESSGNVCFERRLGAFGENEELIERMVETNKLIFQSTGRLKLSLPIYKYLWTPTYSRFEQAEDFFYGNTSRFIQQTIDEIKCLLDKGQLSSSQYNFMSYLLSRKELKIKDVFVIALSLFGDGLSTTTPTFLFLLYCVAKHQGIQEKIYEEVSKFVPKDETITIDVLNRLQLVKATLKETLRMYPNGTEISRITQNDLVLSNYHVPSGTHVDLNHFVHLKSAEYFDEPLKFIPERWLRDDSHTDSKTSAFLFMPFGHGTRMCAGRRFAEQDIYVGLARLLQRYKLELVSPNVPMEQIYETLMFPKYDLKLKFIRR